jgi:hypothetical protein
MNSPNDLIPPLAGLIIGIAGLLWTKYMVHQRKKELARREK